MCGKTACTVWWGGSEPDKYNRLWSYSIGYGLFSNRLKGKLLPKARSLLKQPAHKDKPKHESWRERIQKFTSKDPLICENCSIEMDLVFVCYGLVVNDMLSDFNFNSNDKIPSKQFKLTYDTS